MACGVLIVSDAYDKALQKAQNPRMTTNDNPLATRNANDYVQQQVVDRNMQTLRNDADARSGVHGRAYEAIMNTRFNG